METFQLIAYILAILALAIYFFKQKYSYWKTMGIPSVETVFPFGNIKGIGTEMHSFEVMQKLYNKLKKFDSPFAGIYFYTQPVVLVTSMDFVRTVLVKDSSSFMDRGSYYNEEDQPVSAHLFNVDNPKWKKLRTKLTPTFTSGKMKMMFHTVTDVCDKFVKTLESEAKTNLKNEIEIKDILARFTTDVISSCAFGLECNSLEDPNTEFRIMSKKIFDNPKFSILKLMLLQTFRKLANKLHITALPKDSEEFFCNVVKQIINYRETHSVNRNDFMHLMIQMKNNGSLDGEESKTGTLTVAEIQAQALIFFLAGFETSSTAMCYSLFELSQNQKVQDKARASVNKVLEKHEGKFTYEAMMDMVYIENCINESLRKYPPVSNITRVCNKEYQVEGTNFVIKKGQLVMIPVNAIQNDSDIYPNPEIYEPDRFTQEECDKRSPYSFLSFGQGPRNCIGLRFGMMQARIGLAMLLKNFKFEPCSRSVNPITFANELFILTPKDGVFLKVTKI